MIWYLVMMIVMYTFLGKSMHSMRKTAKELNQIEYVDKRFVEPMANAMLVSAAMWVVVLGHYLSKW